MLPSRYSYTKHIGQGGFGSVDEYFDESLERKVAIKHIEKSSINEMPEFSFIKKIQSKHVVGIYDVIENSTKMLIVQELLSGIDLNHKVSKCSILELTELAYQILTGITDIHNSGVCHRDIKLDNMRFDSEGVLKIFDFGISRSGAEHLTNNAYGSIDFASPELFTQDSYGNSAISFASDVYSFGACFSLLITGQRHNYNPYRPNCLKAGFHLFNLDYHPELIQALNNSLATDPSKRPSALELKILFHNELVKDKHSGLIAFENQTYPLNKDNRIVNLKINKCQATIYYDGFSFKMNNVAGNIYCNNIKIYEGMILPQACVFTMPLNTYISFSSSHPEVVL